MSMNLKKKTTFYIRENLEGKSEKILKINCNDCSEIKKDFYNNINCKYCFLENIYKNKNEKFKFILIECKDILVESRNIVSIFNYFKKLNRIKTIYQKIVNYKTKKCRFKGFKCKIFPNYDKIFKLDDNCYYNPVLFYSIIREKFNIIKKKRIKDSICQNCYNYLKDQMESILRIFKNMNFIKEFDNFKSNKNLVQKISDFYDFLLIRDYPLIKTEQSRESFILVNNEDLIEIYEIGKYKLFQISIFNIIDEAEKKYDVKLSWNSLADKTFFKNVTADILKHLEVFKLERIIPLENLIRLYKREALKIITSKYHLPKLEQKKICFFTALKKLNLSKLFPLLIDDYIEEIFLDSPETKIYINHQKYGRCRTDFRLNTKEIERIKTLLRLYSKHRLDYMNPSIKYVMKNKYFYCRFAIDIEPVHVSKFALDIRKLNKNILTVQDLIRNKTLNPSIAAFLFFNVLRRVNITVTGETDTGKTTFINAFDLITPKEFRKVYVENVEESLNQFKFNKHQLKYQADSLEDSIKKKRFSKSNYIKTLLHRTPDIIYLGEILTKEESEAMFHCLAAGLKGFQTIHSSTIDSLINRFLHHFKINYSCLNDLDLIILMKKDINKRRVVSLAEIDFKNFGKGKYYQTIFQYNPESKIWDNLKPLYETNTINKLRKYEDISREKFYYILNIYKNIFEFLSKDKKINNENLVNFFHKISFYSITSINLLENFWNEWKNNRSLKS
ncbi:MAG: ATPase, T2SS/T4P/T4SS family [Promethearchaeota archaeon]